MPFPIIPLAGAGAISEAAGTIIEKKILRNKKVNFVSYDVFSFVAILILMIPIFFVLGYFLPEVFAFRVSSEAFQLNHLLILAGIVFAGVLANYFIFFAMKWEKMTIIEPIRLMQPLFIIFLAFFFYSSERHTQPGIIIASIIAALALIFSHIKKHHVQFNKYSLAALFGSLFFALDMALSKAIIAYYSPITLYAFRCFFIFILTFAIFRPKKVFSMGKGVWRNGMIAATIWIFYRFLLYTSYVTEGVILTTLLFILAPILICIFSAIFFKEKMSIRNIIATIIIIACVAYAIFFG